MIFTYLTLQWQQFISQIISSQWLPKAAALLRHTISSYNSFKGIALARLILMIFDALHQLGHNEILFLKSGHWMDTSEAEDVATAPMALTLMSEAAKSVSLPDSFRGSCVRSLALAILHQVASRNEADHAAMER